MRTVVLRLLAVGAILSNCTSIPVPLPATSWANGCIELSPYQGVFRLSGMCCEYILLPTIQLDNNRSFVSKGTNYIFTGAGYADSPVLVSGHLSADGSTLSIQYSAHASLVSYELKRGQATLACLCACD